MTNYLISHVEGLFDIVGKTVDNVTYSPPQGSGLGYIQIDFTDGTTLTIQSNLDFTSASLYDPHKYVER